MSTEPSTHIIFGVFRLDQEQGQLWRDDHAVAVQPKPLAVLQYLAQRPGQVVSSKELLKSVWAGVYVTKAVVKECMRAIRGALGEDATAPQYIETVGREGYRFIGAGHRNHLTGGSSPFPHAVSTLLSHQTPMVGREAELAQLQTFLSKALDGQPQVIFVTGEPGIGKTTVIDRFREQVQANDNVTIGYGQCIEQYGGGEAYLPILEAMGRLCREAGGHAITATLRQNAPTWLVQLPGVLNETEAQTLRSQVQGATQQRMLREIAEAIAAGTVRRPLVFLLEDLHWSDQATIELLSYLAQRRERARLMIVGTYRPADLVLGNHPLKAAKQELFAKRLCEEVRLELLSEHAVREYLDQRFPHHQFPAELARILQHRTEGNALFMVNFVEELRQQGYLVEEQGGWNLTGDISQVQAPDTLRQLIEKQLSQLREEEQHVLEVASVSGSDFVVSAVAAGLRQDADSVEEVCEELARKGHFLVERGIAEWPDGTISGKYSFGHALYQNVLYDRIAEARRVRLHRLIGERTETGYGERARELATELAVHFEQGHDFQRAVWYLEHAGKNAVQRSAHREAITLLTKGLELLKTLPDTPERGQQELMLQITLGAPLMATKGYAAPEVERAYARARGLCQRTGETPQLFRVLYGLRVFYMVRAEYNTAYELAERLLNFAKRVQDRGLLLLAHYALGNVLFFLGEFALAREHLEQVIALYDPQQHNPHTSGTISDTGVGGRGYAGWVLWFLGYPDQALQKVHEALTLARKLFHAFALAEALHFAAQLHQIRRDIQLTRERAEMSITLSTEQGFAQLLPIDTMLRGWALAEQGQEEEGIAQILRGLAASQAAGAEFAQPFFLTQLAEVYGKAGQAEEGLVVLAEALARVGKTGERFYEAEIYRLKGALTLQQENRKSKSKNQRAKLTDPRPLTPDPQGEAEACFQKAIDIARKQQAKSLELRATTSLARLWQQQGKGTQAHKMLSEIYNWFTEGFDTKDLQEAKALIEELNH